MRLHGPQLSIPCISFPSLPLLLLLLSRFSHVRICATPQMAAHHAPLSLGFSRQEPWSGLPFPSPVRESKSESEVAQLCPTLSDPMDCSLPVSSAHGIFQARIPSPSPFPPLFISIKYLDSYSYVLRLSSKFLKNSILHGVILSQKST